MEDRRFDLDSITVRTEALQVLTSEEAAYYRLLPYDVDAEGRFLVQVRRAETMPMPFGTISSVWKERCVRYVPVEDLSRLLAIHYRTVWGALQSASV